MASVLAKGTTVIDNAAREPEIADLAAFLNRMGARVLGAGSSTITVEGVESLNAVDHTVIPDRIEAATFLAALGVAGGEITIEGARADHMDMLIDKLGEMGMRISPTASGLWAMAPGRLHATDVATLPYPGIATDYKPLFVALLALADGVGIVTENIFSGRFRYVDELVRMGADVRTDAHHVVVRGREQLSGAPVRAPDIRAGAALVVAGLRAEGETTVHGAEHVDRGYEGFVDKLARPRRRRHPGVAASSYGSSPAARSIFRFAVGLELRRRPLVGEVEQEREQPDGDGDEQHLVPSTLMSEDHSPQTPRSSQIAVIVDAITNTANG